MDEAVIPYCLIDLNDGEVYLGLDFVEKDTENVWNVHFEI